MYSVKENVISTSRMVMRATSGAGSWRGVARKSQSLTFVAPAPVILIRSFHQHILYKRVVSASRMVMRSTSGAGSWRGVARKSQSLTFVAPAPVILIHVNLLINLQIRFSSSPKLYG